jgi:hypothetical protein
MRLHAKLLLGASLAALTLAPSRSAHAHDDKSYPAFMCVESGSGTGDFNRSEYRLTRTGSAGDGLLLCPFIRDSFTDDAHLLAHVNYMGAEITVMDNHFDEDITCALISKKLSDGSAFAYTSAKTEGSSTTVKKISLVDYDFAMEGYGFLKCSVPTNGTRGYTRIFAYKIQEGI